MNSIAQFRETRMKGIEKMATLYPATFTEVHQADNIAIVELETSVDPIPFHWKQDMIEGTSIHFSLVHQPV
jgi:hypothetical protein